MIIKWISFQLPLTLVLSGNDRIYNNPQALELIKNNLQRNCDLLFNHANKKMDIEGFKHLLQKGIRPSQQVYEIAIPEIRAILDYRPGRKKQTIFEYCQSNYISSSKIKWLLYEQENSSDEESTDEETDVAQVLKPVNLKNNQSLLYRSLFSHPSYFKTTKERHEACTTKYHQKGIYSYATYQLALKLPRRNDDSIDYEKADSLVRGYFTLLKLTPDKVERYASNRINERGKEHPFESLYYHFIQAYKNSYPEVINNGGMSRNFNFYSNDNPVVSTSKNAQKSSEYVTRAVLKSEGYKPIKLRRSTGTFKHRRFGYIVAAAVDDDYTEKNAFGMDILEEAQKIRRGFFYKSDEEIGFESSIPAVYIVGYQVFALPDLNHPWSDKTQHHFGLTESEYKLYHKQFLKGDSSGIPALILKVTEHQVKCLIAKLQEVNLTLQVGMTNNCT